MDPPKQSLLSSLSIGRGSRLSRTSDPIPHPLLGASSSSLNLAEPSEDADAASPLPSPTPGAGFPYTARSVSASLTSTARQAGVDVGALPYKPRQRHERGQSSVSSIHSLAVPPTAGVSAAATMPISVSLASAASPTLAPASAVAAPPSPSGAFTLTGPSGVVEAGMSAMSSTLPVSAATASRSLDDDPALRPRASSSSLRAAALPGSGSTSASATASSSTPSSAATSKLQLQSLKAAAQRIGLGNGSMGMGMIDAIFEKGQVGRTRGGEGDWGEVLRVLTSGKAIIMLPTTPASSLPITPQTLRDHIAFLAPPVATPSSAGPSAASVLVTLSGLVGTLQSDAVVLESTVPSDAPLLTALRDGNARAAALSTLRPTQATASGSSLVYSASLSSSAMPSYVLSSESATLSFPPLGKGPAPAAQPEPKAKDKDTSKLGRINPFASLFGAAPTSPRNKGASAVATPLGIGSATGALTPDDNRGPSSPTEQSRASSPRPSLRSLDPNPNADTASIVSLAASDAALSDGYHVAAYTIAKPVRYAEAHKALTKSLRTTARAELDGLPDKVVERVVRLVLAAATPTATAGGADAALLKSHHGHGLGSHDEDVVLDFADPADTGERLQDFMEAVYDELIAHYRSDAAATGVKRKTSAASAWNRATAGMNSGEADVDDDDKEVAARARRGREQAAEREASDGTERVEALVCRVLIFSPIGSDDARHDEALASRIAALNMLDLSLDHLGLITRPDGEVDPGATAAGLVRLVDEVGAELQNLASAQCLTPRAKADVLVKAHKVVVDALATLPPVKLRPEGEVYVPPPASSPVIDEGREGDAPMSQAMESTSSNASVSSQDPMSLSTIAEVSEKTPLAFSAEPAPPVPDLILPDSATLAPSEIEAAMADSLHDLAESMANAKADQGLGITLSGDDSDSNAQNVPTGAPPAATSPAAVGSTSGADLILPLIIYAVVKSNPAQLASQLMYLRRYRSAICLTGEASYAIVNLTAVVEFLEHVALEDLGLGDGRSRVMSVDDLSPIGLTYMDEAAADTASIASASSRLRGRVLGVGAGVGELAGTAADSATKVITGVTGVVDSSWSALRGLIASSPADGHDDGAREVSPGSGNPGGVPGPRPGMRARQASTFSLASVTASVANIAAAATTAAARTRSRASSRASASAAAGVPPEHVWGGNQEMIDVSSRPGSIRVGGYSDDEDDEDDSEPDEDDEYVAGRDGHGAGGHTEAPANGVQAEHPRRATAGGSVEDRSGERVSIGNRLASIGVLGRLGGGSSVAVDSGGSTPPDASKTGFLANLTNRSGSGHARRSSLLGGSPAGSAASVPLPSSTPALATDEAPLERFLTCEVGDIRLHEIGVLLRDYRRLAGIVARLQGSGTPNS